MSLERFCRDGELFKPAELPWSWGDDGFLCSYVCFHRKNTWLFMIRTHVCVCVQGAFSTPVAGMASAVKHPQSQVPHTPTQCFIFVPILFNKTLLHVLLGCLFFFSIPIVYRFEPANLKPHTQKSHPECSVLYNHSTDKKNSTNNKCSVSHILYRDQPTGQRHRTCCLGNSLLK